MKLHAFGVLGALQNEVARKGNERDEEEDAVERLDVRAVRGIPVLIAVNAESHGVHGDERWSPADWLKEQPAFRKQRINQVPVGARLAQPPHEEKAPVGRMRSPLLDGPPQRSVALRQGLELGYALQKSTRISSSQRHSGDCISVRKRPHAVTIPP